MNPKYLQKMHNKALKKRYLYSRNHCMKKHWSGRRRYKCFQLQWAEFQPGEPNNLNDIRNRVQSDCMRYRDHPTLRKACFEAHVNHYSHELVDENKLLAEKNDEFSEELESLPTEDIMRLAQDDLNRLAQEEEQQIQSLASMQNDNQENAEAEDGDKEESSSSDNDEDLVLQAAQMDAQNDSDSDSKGSDESESEGSD